MAGVLQPRVAAGLVGITSVTELEIGYSARSLADYHETQRRVSASFIRVAIPYGAEDRAREVQAALVERGHHRSAGAIDLLVAATAEIERLTLLAYDADFDVVASVTGQAVEWVVPRGSVD